MKLNKFGKTSQLHLRLHTNKKQETHKRTFTAVSLNKWDSI